MPCLLTYVLRRFKHAKRFKKIHTVHARIDRELDSERQTRTRPMQVPHINADKNKAHVADTLTHTRHIQQRNARDQTRRRLRFTHSPSSAYVNICTQSAYENVLARMRDHKRRRLRFIGFSLPLELGTGDAAEGEAAEGEVVQV